jgi:hypothetical protein
VRERINGGSLWLRCGVVCSVMEVGERRMRDEDERLARKINPRLCILC